MHAVPAPITHDLSAALSIERAAELLRLARCALAAIIAGQSPVVPSAANSDDPEFEQVNLTVYVDRRLRASMAGRAASLPAACIAAAGFAATDDRFGPAIAMPELPRARLELWIQRSSKGLARISEIDLGLHGIELRHDRRRAYFKPSVALTSAVKGRVDLLDRLSLKAGLERGAWREPAVKLRLTQWEHFSEPDAADGAPLRLRRLRPIHRPLSTPGTIEHALSAACRRLIAAQQPNGHFLYLHHPFKAVPPGAVHLLRQAGCAFGLARAARSSPEASVAAKRAIHALLAHAAPLPADGVFIAEPETSHGKLGTIGLLLAAMQSCCHPGQEPLRRSLLALQRHDGSFRCSTDFCRSVDQDGPEQDYYPGEALLALCLRLPIEPALVWPAIQRAFPFYRARFDAQPCEGFILWQTDAWRLAAEWLLHSGEVHDLTPQACAEFVFRMADWTLERQINSTNSPNDDWWGGFKTQGAEPDFGTAALTEALLRASGLAARLHDHDRAARYWSAATLGLEFLLRLQIAPETAPLFHDPALAVGATPRSLSSFLIRCDYDQHTITAYLAAQEVVAYSPGLANSIQRPPSRRTSTTER